MIRMCVTFLSCLVGFSQSAVAQQQIVPPAGIPRGTQLTHLGPGLVFAFQSKSLLLQNPQVQAELKLTPDQKTKLKTIEDGDQRLSDRLMLDFQKARQELVQKQADRQELAALGEKLAEMGRQHRERYEAERTGILDRNQRTRLEQIQLQAEGPMAFIRPDIQKRLNTSPDQDEMIAAIVTEGRAELNQTAALPPGTMPTGILTAEQRRELWESQSSIRERSRRAARRRPRPASRRCNGLPRSSPRSSARNTRPCWASHSVSKSCERPRQTRTRRQRQSQSDSNWVRGSPPDMGFRHRNRPERVYFLRSVPTSISTTAAVGEVQQPEPGDGDPGVRRPRKEPGEVVEVAVIGAEGPRVPTGREGGEHVHAGDRWWDGRADRGYDFGAHGLDSARNAPGSTWKYLENASRCLRPMPRLPFRISLIVETVSLVALATSV